MAQPRTWQSACDIGVDQRADIIGLFAGQAGRGMALAIDEAIDRIGRTAQPVRVAEPDLYYAPVSGVRGAEQGDGPAGKVCLALLDCALCSVYIKVPVL